MRLEHFEQAHGDFYVPTFVVEVGRQDLVRELFLTVSSVSVDLKERSASRFSVQVGGAFDWEKREFVAGERSDRADLLELFAFGSKVEISIGYGEPARLPKMLTGIVTEISTSFTSGGTPALTISGYDDLYPLTIGQSSTHWEESRDSDAVDDVAARRGLRNDVETTEPVKGRIDQSQETDMAFIEKLAKRNRATFYMRDGTFRFGKRRNKEDAVASLVWGEGLLSFSPQANLARQITGVEVYGWSPARGDVVVGRASRGDETGRDSRSRSGADRVVDALSDTPVVKLRAAVHTQAEADAYARAVLEDRAQEFVTGRGECIGLPEILPDVNVALEGMGRGFSKTYYVSEATHSLDSGGYRTSFEVQETTV